MIANAVVFASFSATMLLAQVTSTLVPEDPASVTTGTSGRSTSSSRSAAASSAQASRSSSTQAATTVTTQGSSSSEFAYFIPSGTTGTSGGTTNSSSTNSSRSAASSSKKDGSSSAAGGQPTGASTVQPSAPATTSTGTSGPGNGNSTKADSSSSAEKSASALSPDIRRRLTWDKIEEAVPVIPSIAEWKNPSDASRIDLGCFTEDGEWTDNRKECAANQQPFIQQLTIDGRNDDDKSSASSRSTAPSAAASSPASTNPEALAVQNDAPVRAAIDEEFVARQTRAAKIDGLTSSVLDAVASFDRLAQGSALPESAKATVRLRIANLRQLLANTDSLTVTEIDERLARAVREISGATDAVKESMKHAAQTAPVPSDADMTRVLSSLDRIVAAAPGAHDLLSSQNVRVLPEAVEALANARSALQKTHDSCASLSRCPSLPDTVTSLEYWRDAMRKSAGSRADLLGKIEAMISGQ